MMNRLFIAGEIPDVIKEEIISIRDEIYGYDDKVRWEKKGKLHITLKFLGDVEDSRNDLIISELQKIILGLRPVDCSFTKFGIFKRNGIPSILWVGLNEKQKLGEIAGAINNQFVNIGFEKEKRKFNAHLTLSRLKGKENLDNIYEFLNYKLPEIEFRINQISLIKSELLKSGSVYTKLQSFELS